MDKQTKQKVVDAFDFTGHIIEKYLYFPKDAKAVADLLRQNTDIAYEFCSTEDYPPEHEAYICSYCSAQDIAEDTGCSRVAAYAILAYMDQHPEEQSSVLKAIQDLAALRTNGILYGDGSTKKFVGYKEPFFHASDRDTIVYGVNDMDCWELKITCKESCWSVQNYHFTSEKDVLAFLLRLSNQIQADKPTPWYKPTNIFITNAATKQPQIKLFDSPEAINSFLAEHREDSVWITDISTEYHVEELDLQGEFYKGIFISKESPEHIIHSEAIFTALFESYSLSTDYFVLYCYGNRELAHGIAKGFHDRIALACDIPSYDEEAAHIMYAEIDKQLKILKDFANDIQQHGPKIIWHGDTPDEHHEEQDFFVDNNNALSVSGLADNTLKLMNYILKTVLPAEQTSGESISLGEKLYAMEHNGISYGGQLKNYEGLTSIEAILEHPVNSMCFCWDDKWKFIISDSEGHTLEEFYYSSYEETLQAINACTGIPDGSAPVEWLTPSHVCLTQADAKPIQVKWMRTIKELNKFLDAHPGNSVYEVTLCGYYEDFPCIENYNVHGTVHNCILYYDDTVAEIFLKACFHSAEYFIIYGRQDKLAAAETTKCLSALLGIHMDIDICDDDEIDEDENTFESVRTEFQTMSRYLDIYQQWGAGVPITELIEKYQTDEENIANAITACEDRYLKPILGDFMLEEGSSKRIAEMIKKYVPKFTF